MLFNTTELSNEVSRRLYALHPTELMSTSPVCSCTSLFVMSSFINVDFGAAASIGFDGRVGQELSHLLWRKVSLAQL